MLKFYNTFTRKKEVFRSRKDKKVNLFVCGPTTYDFSHIGHARTYIVFDAFGKYLKQKGFNVFYLQNITDIDDKIIIRAKEKKITPKKLALFFEKEYLKDMKALKIDSVTKYARATNHIKEIIGQIKKLLDRGFAYRIKDGVYYDILKFKNYGKLSGRTVLQAEDAVSRIDETKDKRNKGDFCLWKYAKSLRSPTARSMRKGICEYEPSWPSPWGPGRPGWHIEDTAITEKFFGPQYDIHGGARDLIFPHHEAEIAQMEAISGKSPMVNYWLHTGFLTVKGKKMAKSLGNFITIKDFLNNYSPRVLRLFVLKSHYRSPINYSEKLMFQTKKELERINEFLEKLKAQGSKRKTITAEAGSRCGGTTQSSKLIKKIKEGFEKAMEDDFNTSKAVAVIFELINKGNSLMNKNLLSRTDARDILKFLRGVDKVFGFISWSKKKEKIPKEILKLTNRREKYRQQKKWKKADEVRKEIEKLGYKIKDTEKGPKLKRI